MSPFWHGFIVVLTVASLVGCLWLLFANARGTPGEGTTGHVWDEDLSEYNNPLPRWWLNLFILTVVFAVGYLVVYPGLGSYAGIWGWTQDNQLEQRMEAVRARRQTVYASLGQRDPAALSKDPSVMALGREIFLGNCAGCHGADARGAIGFPNLADRDWLYGGSPDAIMTSIREGRHGQMPPFNGGLEAKKVDDLVAMLQHGFGTGLREERRANAMKQFSITCAVCHGAEGKGNPAMGAPNLTDDIWLHGGSTEQIRHSLLFGRQSNMPAHKDLLSADDIRVVTGYVYGLSQ